MRTLAIVLLLCAGACSLGPRASEHPIARGPMGAKVTLSLGIASNGELNAAGELLAVSDSGLWILVGGERPGWAAYGVIKHAVLDPVDVEFDGPGVPPPAVLDRMRMASRYPEGLTPELRKRLLVAYGRDSLLVIHP